MQERRNDRNARLRARIAEDKILQVPGAYDGLSAKLVEHAGAEAVYLSGSGVAASLGLPDLGLVSFTEMLERANQIAEVVCIPVVTDGDTGYGGPLNVVRTVRAYEKVGVSAIQIEDQVFPKRCGHFEAKQVIPLEEMLAKIYAALDARWDENFLIIARTDARATHGLEEAIRRGHAFAEAGADIVFVEAPQSREELARIAQEIDAPLLVNLPEGGKTPLLTAQQLEHLGYDMVIHANTALRAAAKQMLHVLRYLLKHGTSQGIVDQLITFEDRDELTGLPELQARETAYTRAAGLEQEEQGKRERGKQGKGMSS
ncbi:MAG: oxaloacetate decarboxylase [Candidatus Bipolaricaulia bacterium]